MNRLLAIGCFALSLSLPAQAEGDPLADQVRACLFAFAERARESGIEPHIFARRAVLACPNEKRAYISAERTKNPVSGAKVAEHVVHFGEEFVSDTYRRDYERRKSSN